MGVMAAKRTRLFTMRMSDDELAKLAALARGRGMASVAELVRALVEVEACGQKANRAVDRALARGEPINRRPPALRRAK
jgi:hypothetical protein